MALHNRILIGLIIGAAAGIAVNVAVGVDADWQVQWLVTNLIEPVGRIWLNGLIMAVIPLVLSTLALAVAGLGSVARLARIGGLTLLCFLALTTLAAMLGLGLAALIRPGVGLDESVRQTLMEAHQGQSSQAMGLAKGGLSVNTVINVVPRNPVQAMANGEMLAVIFLALMIGLALALVSKAKAQPLRAFLESLAHVTIKIIDIVMRFAPYGVACLVFGVMARFGFDLLASLAAYVATVIAGLVILMFVVYSIVLKVVARRSPLEFFGHARVVMLTAFATSSATATLPTTLKVTQEQLKVPNEVSGIVVPLGASANMNGTALFKGATVLFVAQAFGIDLTVGQLLIVIVMTVLTVIGAAGVPGGSIPALMMVMGAVGVPMEGIAVMLGVDRILDMCRTTVNVVGAMITAAVVDRYAGLPDGTIL